MVDFIVYLSGLNETEFPIGNSSDNFPSVPLLQLPAMSGEGACMKLKLTVSLL